jgi:tetratricopeptide (TPR) repeat protein
MPKVAMVFAALLAACSSAGALGAADLSSLVFWAAPLTDTPAAPSGSAPAIAREQRPAHETARASVSSLGSASAAQADNQAEIDRQLGLLNEAVAQHGEQSQESLDPLVALAELYRQRGQEAAATAALEQAIHVLRVNSGLFALDQADVVVSLIASREAAGQHAEAAALGEYLQELVARNPDDTRVPDVLTSLADSEMDAARHLLGTAPAPDIHVATEANGAWTPTPPAIKGPAEKAMLDARRRYEAGLGAGWAWESVVRSPALKALLDARGHYGEAIEAGRRNGTMSGAELLALQDRLLDTLYFEFWHRPQLSQYEEPEWRVPEVFSQAVVRALGTKIDFSESFGRDGIERAKARLELGDWYLLFDDTAKALDQYQQAYDLLRQSGVSEDVVATIVSPTMPALLPVAARPEARAPRGYVDVAVATRFGRATDVDVLAASPGTTRAIERRVQQYVNRSRFRPRFIDGQLARSDRFTARFYFDY